ncbi:MAG: MFS transporter [Spirochaetaceae bacterium]
MTTQIESGPGPRVTIAAILASAFLLGAGTTLQSTIVAYRAGILGFSEPIIGIIMSSFFIGFIAGPSAVVFFIRRVGYIRTFSAFATLASTTSLFHLLIQAAPAWIVLRMLHGLCVSGMLVIVESWLNISTSSYNRGRVLGLYSLIFLAAMGAAQPLIGLLSPGSFEIFVLTSILISVSLIPLAITQVGGTPIITHTRIRLIQTLRRAPLAAFGVIVAGVSSETMWALAPLYGQRTGLSAGETGTLLLFVSLGALASQWPLGAVSDTYSRRGTIFASSIISTLSAAAIAVLSPAGIPLFLLAFLYGSFCMPLYSLAIALFNDQLSSEEMVEAAGALIVFYGLGSMGGPYGASLVMGQIGSRGLFIFIGVILAVYSAVTFVQLSGARRISPAQDQETGGKEHYHPYPRTTFAAFSLIKRAVKKGRRPAAAALRTSKRQPLIKRRKKQ